MAETDFISRRAIYDAVNDIGGCDATEEWAKGYDSAIDAVMGIIEGVTAADVAEVVRCKDCKYLEITGCYGECGKSYLGIVRPDCYCCYGERRE